MSHPVNTPETLHFLRGGGNMGQLTRQFLWEQTPVGHAGTWPCSLRITVSNLLRSKFPMFLWWGADRIQFYNDAYRPSFGTEGKHPQALGQKGADCWPEIWATVSPLLTQVEATGEAIWLEDQLIPIVRNGKLENVRWTFSYSSILNDDGTHGGTLVTCLETTDKVIARQMLQQEEEKLRNTILQAPAAICIFRGANHVIEIANAAMFEFWGRPAEEVLNKPLFEAMPETRGQGYEELLSDVITTGKPYSASELPVTLPRNGVVKTVYINFTYNPIREPDGTVSGIMAMATDVTAQVESRKNIEAQVGYRTEDLRLSNEKLRTTNDQLLDVNDALIRSNLELQRSNKNLEEFAYAASHDLKEPVRKVHFFAERIKSTVADRLNEEEKRYFERMEVASERMGILIDDLLTYSRVSMRPKELEHVDTNTIINEVMEDLDLEIEAKAALIEADHIGTIYGHKHQLRQVFLNLVGNALKYSRPGVAPHIRITCREEAGTALNLHLRPAERQLVWWLITVTDNGIGFEQQDAERIFNVFTRLHGNTEYKGTGVGLSIVRKVVENHNGFVTAEGRPGTGSTFTLYFPVG